MSSLPSSTTTKQSLRTRLWKKWLLLVIALVVLSVIRYRFSVQEIASADPEKHKHKQVEKRTNSSGVKKPKEKHEKKPDDDAKRKHSSKDATDTTQKPFEPEKREKATESFADKKRKEKSASEKKKSLSKNETSNVTEAKSKIKDSQNETTATPKSERIKESKNETNTALNKSKNETLSKAPKESKNETTTKSTHNTTTESSFPVQKNDTSLVPPYDKQKADQFTNASCLLQQTEWFPSVSNDKWQLRAPRFMILGARDSGTRMVASQLLKHSQMASNSHSTQELAYFSQPSFLRASQSQHIHVWRTRQRMYARDYPSKLLKSNFSLITMDATPDYLFYSDSLPRSILCTCPWIKILIILRNPANRVYASFRRASSLLGWKGSFEEYVRLDMETMERAGLIGQNKKQDTMEAWRLYLSDTKDGPVGRSFYEIQLQQWFSALREMGRDPLDAVRVVRYEEWKVHPKDEYQRVLEFLGLPMEHVVSSSSNSNSSSSLAINEQDELTMTRLRKFFRPYNKRLYNLLGENWFGCWDDEE